MKLLRDLNDDLLNAERVRDFINVVRYAAISKGRLSDARLHAEQARAGDRVLSALTKAVAGSTSNWGAALVPLSQSFLASLRGYSAFDTILPAGRLHPLRTQISVAVSIATAGQVEAGGFKLCTDLGFDTANLVETKSATITVYSAELAKLGGPAGLATIESAMRAGLSRATDEIFCAGLSAGLTGLPSLGSPLADIRQLALAIENDAVARLFAIVSPRTCKTIALSADSSGSLMFPNMSVFGGEVGGLSVLPSDGCADDQMIGVDASQLAMNGGTIDLNASAEALVDMDTETGDTGAISLWQRNGVGARIERLFGFQPMRASACALVENINYESS